MNLPWLRPRGASIADLEQQLEGARGAHEATVADVKKAQAAFDDDPSLQRALAAAQDAERTALAHVGRAERLLAQAQAKAEAETRAQLERQVEQLRDQLSAPALEKLRAPSRDAEIEALKVAVAARVERERVEAQIRELESELKRVRAKLGEPQEAVYHLESMRFAKPSTSDVGAALAEHYRPLGVDDPHARCARAISAYLNAL